MTEPARAPHSTPGTRPPPLPLPSLCGASIPSAVSPVHRSTRPLGTPHHDRRLWGPQTRSTRAPGAGAARYPRGPAHRAGQRAGPTRRALRRPPAHNPEQRPHRPAARAARERPSASPCPPPPPPHPLTPPCTGAGAAQEAAQPGAAPGVHGGALPGRGMDSTSPRGSGDGRGIQGRVAAESREHSRQRHRKRPRRRQRQHVHGSACKAARERGEAPRQQARAAHAG